MNTHRTRLHLEPLEAREVPAGVVTLAITGSSWTLTGDGDAAGNEVRIKATAGNNFLLTGLSGTTFKVGATNVGGTVNTSTLTGFAFPDNSTTKVTVNFGEGPDRFEYDGAAEAPRKFGDIVINTGVGNDTVWAKNFLARNLTVNSTEAKGFQFDNDTVVIAAGGKADFGSGLVFGAGGISGNVTFNAKNGNDSIGIGANVGGGIKATGSRGVPQVFVYDGNCRLIDVYWSVSGVDARVKVSNAIVVGAITLGIGFNLDWEMDNVSVGGNVNVKAMGVGSKYDLNAVSIGGALNITHTGLASSMSLTGVQIGKTATLKRGNSAAGDLIQDTTIAGKLTATYGAGNDLVTMRNVTALDGVAVTNSDGVDSFTFENGTVAKDLSYNGGNGGNFGPGLPDRIDNSIIGGALKYTGGTGDDELSISNTRVAGAATFKMGDGINKLSSTQSSFLSAFSFTGGKGVDSVTLGAGTMVFGATSIKTSAGNDSLTISDNGRFKGKVTIDTGTENDTINVSASGGSEVTFLGGVIVTTGKGNDTFNIGQAGGSVVVLNGLKTDFDNANDTGGVGPLVTLI